MSVNVLVVDGGARGHALLWELSQSSSVGTLAMAREAAYAAVARIRFKGMQFRKDISLVAG
ncbi:MAG: hypothetical protein A2677_00875 [Candidatus Komeilibacteria bacterium RIFCSPHIGHO2_01_FULL_52_14]|uniref:Phosphoribosylglycinamide synthetase N-terminal domain-containing protein n=1 Tax=Candidatus Komeilibacteria bacterium RIFCSPHIGHO2_01_FULL_52_14 TaxID=1798549 RepID=A0A1G2BJL2_9BACT|nr:MAG: hypothetical protein A2677_00875 [Candidatus Komeilibacteria bacterium RIFCSPHIGHO2_01_FULL_52_14]